MAGKSRAHEPIMTNTPITTFLRSATLGFTLIEVLITLSILLLVGIAILSFQTDLFSVSNFLQETFSSQRVLEGAIQDIVSELRSASPSSLGAYPIEKATTTDIAFYANIDKDSVKERVEYFVSGTMLKKSVIKPVGNPLSYSTTTASAQESLTIVLRNLVFSTASPLFTYYGAGYEGISTPLVQPVSITAVRVVGIMLSIDESPNRPPPPVTISSKVEFRNLKDNY